MLLVAGMESLRHDATLVPVPRRGSREGRRDTDSARELEGQDFDGRYVGPGGQDVVVGPDGEDVLVFHSWYGGETYRGMNVLPLGFGRSRRDFTSWTVRARYFRMSWNCRNF